MSTVSIRFAILMLAFHALVAGCGRSPDINGEYEISYTWADGKLQSTAIKTVKPQAAQRAIVETVQPYITDGVRAANLKRAAGKIDVTILGSLPYFVQVRKFAITEPDFSLLTVAVEREDVEGIRRMVTAYGNVNQRELPSRQTALAIAAAGRHVKSLRTLLELGADPNLSDHFGITPLTLAIEVGNEDCVAALVRAGANVGTANDPDSAIRLAKKLHRDKLLRLLNDAANP